MNRQNFIGGILIGLTGGLYAALNLLGAGGGKPNSFQVVQTANATLCAVYAVSAWFGGTVLNTIGPALTAFFGVIGYILYVGSLWYFDQHGKETFPIIAAVCISAGFIYVTSGYLSMSYSEENERGKFVATSINLQATGAAIGGLIPLIINHDKATSAGVPPAVYIVFIVMDFVGCALAFLLRPPEKVVRDDGTNIAVVKARPFWDEFKGNLEAFKDWRMLVMIPAFAVSECFLVYGGSANAFRNSLRARSLLGFCSVTLQIICGWALTLLLDNEKLRRKTRAQIGLAITGIPVMAAYIWEMIRTRNYDRNNPPSPPLDWNEPGFGPIFVLFMLNWVSCSLFQYMILYFLGCFTNNPRVAANNAGVFRGFMAAGEAIDFGVDSMGVPFLKESGALFAFYTAGVIAMGYLALFHIDETKYFTEEEVTIPKHVQEEHGQTMVIEGMTKGTSETTTDEEAAMGKGATGVAEEIKL
ncbi:uncharacterized protein Z519_08541 [Cladophialophora bantiana CBS 173.52]|uniref:Autophagy-related protein n=1 Tax=Cladophialophora bantiana (strain ATCC 10958 / CBS 173.52 / CDC B-1940 / NIH 8579) TaxID=1442370 RepID=A0A0D2HBV6_CLAB1|nr:uncharacterized protein Z519_08541 [Cladophialophora bantiana CBS 173.52]KIW90758.1 hypothetical protein Z519_08541 [Cladophialophora bantiana CBS 173.52]